MERKIKNNLAKAYWTHTFKRLKAHTKKSHTESFPSVFLPPIWAEHFFPFLQTALDLSSLSQGGEIPSSQLVQLLNGQESIVEVSDMKVPNSSTPAITTTSASPPQSASTNVTSVSSSDRQADPCEPLVSDAKMHK